MQISSTVSFTLPTQHIVPQRQFSNPQLSPPKPTHSPPRPHTTRVESATTTPLKEKKKARPKTSAASYKKSFDDALFKAKAKAKHSPMRRSASLKVLNVSFPADAFSPSRPNSSSASKKHPYHTKPAPMASFSKRRLNTTSSLRSPQKGASPLKDPVPSLRVHHSPRSRDVTSMSFLEASPAILSPHPHSPTYMSSSRLTLIHPD